MPWANESAYKRETILSNMSHYEATRELKRLVRCKKRLLIVKCTLTKPIPRGGWNSERVLVQEHIRHTDDCIAVLQEKIPKL